MKSETQAIVARAYGQTPALEVVILDTPRADEAIVDITAVGICHADIAVLHGKIELPLPRILGHEGEHPMIFHDEQV